MADASGDILRRYWRAPIIMDRKGDSSPVTLADREAESAMRALIENNCPEHGIIGEEMGNIRTDAALQWVIDPIDGTRSFVAGYPIFTTLIALTEHGIPVLGIIDQPVSGDRWVATCDEDTTHNGRPCATRDCRALQQAVVVTTSEHYFTPSEAELFDRIGNASANVTLGGDAYAYAMLANGHIDLVVDAQLKPYDFCALVPVVQGAGGVITDWKGAALTSASEGHVLAAATPELHQHALKLLSA